MTDDGNTNSEILIHQAEDGSAAAKVQLQSETVWMTQDQIAARSLSDL